MTAERRRGDRVRGRWRELVAAVSWTPPTSTEIGVVLKSGLAAGLAWFVAGVLTDVPDPVLAPLTAIVVVQVSVRASVMSALQRSAAVVLGVFLAIAIGDALGLNAITIGVLVTASLGFAQLVLRLPSPAARQVPVSALVVLAALSATPETAAWRRALDTVIGAAVGVIVSVVLPASRLVDARQTLDRLGAATAGTLEAMGRGLHEEWSAAQTEDWRRHARTTRERLVRQAAEAVGSSREASRWNIRDRRHVDALGRYEEVLPRLERTAIGVSVIARGLDDRAHLIGTGHSPMRSMGDLLEALAGAVRALVDDVLHGPEQADLAGALDHVRERRAACVVAASRRARVALEHDEAPGLVPLEGEWLSYAALLVQVDRVVGDLSAPLPT
jgi:uncharacterized membrane protein YgaE (UPF0421/DUF939 family)